MISESMKKFIRNLLKNLEILDYVVEYLTEIRESQYKDPFEDRIIGTNLDEESNRKLKIKVRR